MQKKKILAMLLSAMIVMSASAVSVSAADPCNPGPCAGGTATCTEPAICDTCGNPYGDVDPNNHSWGEWSAEGTRTCNNGCDATETCNHDDKTTATCTTPATCNTCGKDLGVDENAHSYGEWVDGERTCENGCGTTETCSHEAYDGVTCTSPGTCTECGMAGEEVNENGHVWGGWTSNEDGTHTHTCTLNGEHKADATCDTNGAEGACSECGYKASQVVPATKITAVKIKLGDFEIGGKLPAITNNSGTGYTVTYKWTDDKTDDPLPENTVIAADTTYKFFVTITPEDGYEFSENATQTITWFGKDEAPATLKVVEGIGYINGEVNISAEEPEDKPSTGGSTGGSSSSSSSSSTTTKPAVDTKAETDKIAKAEEGSKVSVKIEGTTVPADYIKTAMESKATVVVDYGSYAWEISDVKTAKAVDLSISRYIMPKTVLNTVKGDNSNVISIKHDGDLGFKGTLKYNVKKANAGKFVNLYYYNLKTKKLELQGSTKIGADGNVFLPFTHCSIYVLNITDKAASNELFEDFSAGESATVVEETLPAVTNAPAATEAPATTDAAANPETGNSAVALVAIPMAIAAAAVISKKR